MTDLKLVRRVQDDFTCRCIKLLNSRKLLRRWTTHVDVVPRVDEPIPKREPPGDVVVQHTAVITDILGRVCTLKDPSDLSTVYS